MIYSAILAAGFGTRMHRQDLPKPFLPLGSKPIIIHTLEQFCVNPNVDCIIIVTADTWRTYAEDLIRKYNIFDKDITVIAGGSSKTESIELVSEYILANKAITNEDIIITHDAIRPFVTQRIINDNIEVARAYDASTTVITTNDTIVISTDEVKMDEVPHKYQMFAEQTPQTFKLPDLVEMFTKAKKENIKFSDETSIARLFLKFGGEMRLVQGEYSNMKIINPYDLEIANALLAESEKK